MRGTTSTRRGSGQRIGEGRLDFEFAMVVEMRDGEITRLREYFDKRPLVAAG